VSTVGHWFGNRLRALHRLHRARLRDAGYVAVMVAIILPVVGVGCAAVAVDVGSWYATMERVQKAADAAALAGVPYLPQDLPSATSKALEVAARNGFDNSSSTVGGHVPNTVTVGLGDKATQLKVTISTTVTNQFGSMIGIRNETITRSSTTDYQGPAPMGSPCNTFGNEPTAGTAGSSPTPSGTAAGTNCPTAQPQLWGTIEGPETGKVQGDRYQTENCEATAVDGCTGDDNDEYDDFGYIFVVKVQTAGIGKSIDLQLYDPMFVNTAQDCSYLPDGSTYGSSGNTNPYVTNADAKNRYSDDGSTSGSFCTGDSYPGNGSGARTKHSVTTSFVLRQQTDTQNAKVAAVQNDTSGNPCIKQYGSYNLTNSTLDGSVFQSSSGNYNRDVAQTFHNWSSLCTFTPTRSGDYYLQVRTNVSLGGTTVSGGTGLITSGNTAAAAATGNTTTGEGANSFSIRAVSPGNQNNVSVSGYNHMPIYMNASSTTANFYLIRVLPGAAGQKISFSYFDAGDAAAGGSVTVLVPTDATGTIRTTPFPGGCVAAGGSAGTGPTTLTGCSAPFTQSNGTSKNNGKTETITIPIPSDYNCASTVFTGCWYKVAVAFGSGAVHDTTTWNATVVGDPVRIIK
jgi:Flp pilus assembly protein TadG